MLSEETELPPGMSLMGRKAASKGCPAHNEANRPKHQSLGENKVYSRAELGECSKETVPTLPLPTPQTSELPRGFSKAFLKAR